jgi:hypothetical protein
MRIIDGGYLLSHIEFESIYETEHNGEKCLFLPMRKTREKVIAPVSINKDRVDELIKMNTTKAAMCKEFNISLYNLNKYLITHYGKATISEITL